MPHNKKPNKREREEKLFNKTALKKRLLQVFYENPSRPFNYKQLAKRINTNDNNTKKLISILLHEMYANNLIEQPATGRYKLQVENHLITGKIRITREGFGTVISAETEEQIIISPKNLNHALNGDTVKLFLYAHRNKDIAEGEVIEVVERANNSFVGTIETSGSFAFLVPDGKTMPFDIFIPPGNLSKAQSGDKAIVQITEWPAHLKNPTGKIIEVLGKAGDHETEMHAVLAEFGLPHKFPEHIIREADKINSSITKEEIAKRRDFRNITTFTIDPVDAKDFDDALSIRKLENGNWEAGVHIADVTHYVKPGDQIDREAQDRGTSVYLVDRVVPMLPEQLSNFICSLRPDEEKLCFSYIAEMNENAEVLNSWFGKTIIKSCRRFHYDEAYQIIQSGKGDLYGELNTMNMLAQKLRKERFNNGAIAFERDDVKLEVDEKGTPLRVYTKQYTEANELVEEFMLLANRQVATFIGYTEGKRKAPTFVYRIHDRPNPGKLESLAVFLKTFGYKINISGNKSIASSINKLLSDVKGKKEQNMIESLTIRTMAKAEYSTDNIGHYGLSFKHYTHFTSPIRRYPDMLVHRLLHRYLNNGNSDDKETIENMCIHSSEMERRAMQAEWASIKYKQIEFLSGLPHDKVFEGIISGVTQWGLFVEINENKCEGLVPIRQLKNDYFYFDEKNYCLAGRRSGKIYRLGDEVKITIAKTNLPKRQVDFELIDEGEF